MPVLLADTIAAFGYRYEILTKGSNRKVRCACDGCGIVFDRPRKQLRARIECMRCSRKHTRKEILNSALEKRNKTMLAKYGKLGRSWTKEQLENRSKRILIKLEEAYEAKVKAAPPVMPPCAPAQAVGAQNGGISVKEALLGLGVVVGEMNLNGSNVLTVEEKKIAFSVIYIATQHELSTPPRDDNYNLVNHLDCKKLEYDLVTIFSDEWATRKKQVMSFLGSKLGLNSTKVDARKCLVSQISTHEANKFLDSEHIQGRAARSSAALGIHLNGELLGVLTLGSHHQHPDPTVMILSRLAFKGGVSVRGGAGRLLGAALKLIKSLGVKRLISWSDNRWTVGGVYGRLGFEATEQLPPNYYYVRLSDPYKRLQKQTMRRKIGMRDKCQTRTEWIHAQGLTRVWDCGKIQWTITL